MPAARLITKLLVALAVLVLSPSSVGAQNTPLNRLGSGARAAGMANAFAAVSDDGTAASWNPAGLAQLRKPELSLVMATFGEGFRLDGFRSPDERFAYSPRRSSYTTSSLDFGALAVPFQLFGKPTTIQLGWRRLYQLSSQMDQMSERGPGFAPRGDPGALLRRDLDSDGNVDLLTAAGAVRVTRRTIIGASLELVRGEWSGGIITVETPLASSVSRLLSVNTHQRLRGQGFTTGLLLTYPKLNVGLVFHAPVWLDYRFAQVVDSSSTPSQRLDSEPGTRMRFPRSIAFGAALRPNVDWTIAADVTRDEWSQTAVDRLPGSPVRTNFFDELPQDRTSTRDTLSLNLGAEKLVRREGWVLPLRFGIAWEPQGPMDKVTRDPVDFVMLAAGAGFNTNHVKLDAAFQYRWAAYRIVDTLGIESLMSGVPDAQGVTRQSEWRFKLSAIYRINDTDKLRQIFRRAFVGEP